MLVMYVVQEQITIQVIRKVAVILPIHQTVPDITNSTQTSYACFKEILVISYKIFFEYVFWMFCDTN